MFTRFYVRAAVAIGAIGACVLTGSASASPGAIGTQQFTGHRSAQSPSGFGRFSRPLPVTNPMFPLSPGTELVSQGKVVTGRTSVPHTEVFTVTDLTKVIDHVRTAVVWVRDLQAGTLLEQELAFFAQDDQGNVWNFGEYPEVYANGKFSGAPDTWIKGAPGSYGGLHMLAELTIGRQYLEGLVPRIGFDDVSKIGAIGLSTCVPAGCYHYLLQVIERSPNDPTSGIQLKYYAPHVGQVRVGARGGSDREYLALTAVKHLSPGQIAAVRGAVLAIDRRAYRVSRVYRLTSPAVRWWP
jgi:hypothetical protein